MKIISWNVNGIRACVKKGFLDYLQLEAPDMICLQETKALPEDLEDHILNPIGYHGIWHSAEKKGYSGVAILTKKKPSIVHCGLGIAKFDREGRVIIAQYDSFVLFSVYFPNGQMSEDRLQYKLEFYKELFDVANDYVARGMNVVICGDYNTAHKAIDLANPRENENYSGFLPIEREWMDRIIGFGYVDTFRAFHSEPDQYSWWTYRVNARARNIGWRIDYVCVNGDFMPHVATSFIQPEVMGSDHCPVGVTIAI